MYDNSAQMLAGLQRSEIDAALLDLPLAVATARDSGGRLSAVAQLPQSETIAAALPKGSANTEAVSSAMRAFTADGTIARLREHLDRVGGGQRRQVDPAAAEHPMMLSPASISISSPTGPALEFLVLFLVVIIGPPLLERARMPGIIGLLLGGFLIGPHGLNLIGAGNTTVPELGQIGLLYLMFVAGVELDLALLRVHRRRRDPVRRGQLRGADGAGLGGRILDELERAGGASCWGR